VSARQHPVSLLFLAPAAGSYTLLSGNAQATAPRYDLAAFAGEMRAAGAASVAAGNLEAMPDYRPRESLGTAPLPDVPLTGAPLDTQAWASRNWNSTSRRSPGPGPTTPTSASCATATRSPTCWNSLRSPAR
jgi:hypothetical protein